VVACSSSSARPPDSNNGAAPANAVRIPVTIDADKGMLTIQAEIADTPALRQQGLMFRTTMGESEGMLFLFPKEEPLSFWMHNTLIPLDMIFIRADRTISEWSRTRRRRRTLRATFQRFRVRARGERRRGPKASPACGQKVNFYAPLPSN